MPEDKPTNASEIDRLIDALEFNSFNKEATPAITQNIMTREEDELMNGVKLPGERGGRLPALYREEVTAILADKRALIEIADDWGVSIETINRVKQRGRFEGIPYIPRDEIDRTLAYDGSRLQRPMNSYKGTGRGIKGRPFKSGRPPLTDEEKQKIADDYRPARDIGFDYGISSAYVGVVKREMGIISGRQRYLPQGVIDVIFKDERDAVQIAMAFKVPRAIVEAIKDGSYDGSREGQRRALTGKRPADGDGV